MRELKTINRVMTNFDYVKPNKHHRGIGSTIFVIAITVIIVAAAAGYYLISGGDEGGEGQTVQRFSEGDSWTWRTEENIIDSLTGEVLSSSTYYKTITYIGEHTVQNRVCQAFKLTTNSPENYFLYYYWFHENVEYLVMIESFSDNTKVGETVYVDPFPIAQYPPKVGDQFSDNILMHAYTPMLSSVDVQVTYTTKVLRKETVIVPAGTFECWVVEYTRSKTGTMTRTIGSEVYGGNVSSTTTETVWISDAVKKEVKREYHDNTTMTWLLTGGEQVYNLGSHKVDVLTSYSVAQG